MLGPSEKPSTSMEAIAQYQAAAKTAEQTRTSIEPDLSDITLPAMASERRAGSGTPLPPVQELPEESIRTSSTSITAAGDSISSATTYQTKATSLPALQVSGGEPDGLEPLADEEVDPGSFDLVMPANDDGVRLYSLETRSELLFSRDHLQAIFEDSTLLHRFSAFLSTHRPFSMPLFTYYLEASKAIRAIKYSNAVARALESLQSYTFTHMAPTEETINQSLQAKADAVFDLLVREDLPAYITHTWIQTVTESIRQRITGTLPPSLRELSEGLAEVFCLTDPSRHDNPIVFASEEFHNTTQYGMSYVIGRNCRFLQGPNTNPCSVARIRERLNAGREHFETFLNYRRDGTPFMNLVMLAPLYDSRGRIRYHLGAQIDVSGLVKQCYGLDAYKRLVEAEDAEGDPIRAAESPTPAAWKDEFRELSELFNTRELETVRTYGGQKLRPENRDRQETEGSGSASVANWQRPRVLIHDGDSSTSLPSATIKEQPRPNDPTLHGRLTGVYENYLLVRPYPSLRVLFASPSLRVPGMLQSQFLNKIGGSERVREELRQAMAEGQGVTAKVRWVGSGRSPTRDGSGEIAEGRPRWIHCTPLLGNKRAIGVWMVVVVDDDSDAPSRLERGHGVEPPPVEPRAGCVKAKGANTVGASGGSLPRRVSSLSGAGAERARSTSPLLDRPGVSEYHSATRSLQTRGSSRALRLPSWNKDKSASGFGLSGVELTPLDSDLDPTMAGAEALMPEPWLNVAAHPQMQWERGVNTKPLNFESILGDDKSEKSVASSSFTVKIGED